MALTRRSLLLAGGGAALAAGLAGCSGASSSGATPSATPAPTRVATLDAGCTENLLQFGLQPVAACEPKAFRTEQPALALAATVPDAGTAAGAYHLDALRAARPQVIVGNDAVVPADLRAQLGAIAPLGLLEGPSNQRPLAVPRANLQTLASLLRRDAKAEALLARLDEAVATTRTALVGRVNGTTAIIELSLAGTSPVVRLFGPGSSLGMLAQQVGADLPTADLGDDHGMVDAGLDALAGAQRILWWSSPAAAAAMKTLGGQQAWTSLPAVRARGVQPLLAGRSAGASVASLTVALAELTNLYGAKPKPSATPAAAKKK